MRPLKRALRQMLHRAGYVVFNTRSADAYTHDGLFTQHRRPFLADPKFQQAYARGVQASDGFDPGMEWRLHVALWAAWQAARVPGDFVECGVNAGFVSSAIMTYLDWESLGRTYYLVDTFAGPVPEQFTANESHQLAVVREAMDRGGYVTNVARSQANFAEWPSARIVQGMVPDVLPEAGAGAVAFLHLDMNCAYPEQEALRHFWPRLSPGGVVLFDDYTYFGHDSLTAALDAVAASAGFRILALPTGQGLVWKAPAVQGFGGAGAAE